MRVPLASASLAAILTATGSGAADPALTPGLYQVEVRIGLPHVLDTTGAMILSRCVAAADLDSGQAFFVLSDNPLKSCDLLDYHPGPDTATIREVSFSDFLTNRTWQDFAVVSVPATFSMTIGWPFTASPFTISFRVFPKGSAPTIQMVSGEFCSGNAVAGHSTNLVKLSRKAALT